MIVNISELAKENGECLWCMEPKYYNSMSQVQLNNVTHSEISANRRWKNMKESRKS